MSSLPFFMARISATYDSATWRLILQPSALPRSVDSVWYAGISTEALSYGSTPKVSVPLGHATWDAAAAVAVPVVLAGVLLDELLLELHAARPRPSAMTPATAAGRYFFMVISPGQGDAVDGADQRSWSRTAGATPSAVVMPIPVVTETTRVSGCGRAIRKSVIGDSE